MENKKTIEYLNSRAWYRALKVVYILFVITCYILAVLAVIGSWLGDDIGKAFYILIFPGAIFIAWIASIVPKLIFYYIVLGSIKPER